MNLIIQRLTKHSIIPTFGVISTETKIPFALTLERPWLDNQHGVSCIPAGYYSCAKVTSPKFGNTFQIMNVPNRDEILFHKGNIYDDSHGCILIGEQFGVVFGQAGITASKAGFEEFINILLGINSFSLQIKDPQQ